MTTLHQSKQLWGAIFLPLALAVRAFTPPDTGSIIIRHDRPDSSYLALGARFPAVARLGGRMGDGTLVAPDWILTAAHVARGMRDRDRGIVRLNDREYRVVDYYLHPDWEEMGPHDIALLKLARPVADIQPMELYRGNDELGMAAVLVGHGGTGSGNSRDRLEDGKRRGATNMIDQADQEYLVFTFDRPPGGTELEGIPGPGDSGGPALVEIGGAWQVAGVSSLGRPGPNGPGTYGATDYFGRVSSHIEWLDDVMAGRVMAQVRPEPSSELPDSPSGRRLKALLELASSNPEAGQVAQFVEANLSSDRLSTADTSQLVARWHRLITRLRGATVTRVMARGDLQTDVELDTSGGAFLLGVRVEREKPHRIEGLFTGRP